MGMRGGPNEVGERPDASYRSQRSKLGMRGDPFGEVRYE